jgi:outer membrane protein W
MKRLLLVLVVVALAAPLSAQQKTEGFVFFDSPNYWGTDTQGSHVDSGYGVALRYFNTPEFSTELSVAKHDQRVTVYDFSNLAAPVITTYHARIMPIDLVTSYHFRTEGRWKPYVGLGLHYLSVSDAPRLDSRLGLQITGGVAFNVTPHFFVRADAKRVFVNNTQPYEPDVRALLGVGWRF